MPIEEILEEGRIYCSRCGDAEGKVLKAVKEDVIEAVKKNYFMDKMGLGEEAAGKQAEEYVNQRPAWQHEIDMGTSN